MAIPFLSCQILFQPLVVLANKQQQANNRGLSWEICVHFFFLTPDKRKAVFPTLIFQLQGKVMRAKSQ